MLINRKLIDTFSGEFFLTTDEIISECLKNKVKPKINEGFRIKKINFVEDRQNKSRFFVGDYEGDEEWYPFTLKIFIYNDGKALGDIKYVAEAKESPQKIIGANYFETDEGFIINGIINYEAQDTEPFIFFIERTDKNKFFTIAQLERIRLENHLKSIAERNHKNKSKEKVSEKNMKNDKNQKEYVLEKHFIKIPARQQKDSCIHYLSYYLNRLGYNIEILDYKGGPSIAINYENFTRFIHVFVSSYKNANWSVKFKEGSTNHYYIFCHFFQLEDRIEVYILKGRQIILLQNKGDFISIEDSNMVRIKDDWSLITENEL